MLLQQSRMLLEQLLTNLQTDGVNNWLSLAPLQSCHNNLKLRCIKHEWHFRYLGLGHSNLHKLLHSSKAIEQTIVHIDVNDVSSVLNLLLCNVHRCSVVAFHHQLLESDRSRNITTLSNVQKWKSQMIVHIVHN